MTKPLPGAGQVSPGQGLDHCRYCRSRQKGVCAAFDASSFDEGMLQDRLRGHWRRVQPGDVVYRQGDPADVVCTLVEGWVMLVHESPAGAVQITDVIVPDGIFGIEPCDQPFAHSAVALTEATVCTVSRTHHDDLRHRNPTFDDAVDCAMACMVRRAHDQVANVAQNGATARVAHLLYGLAIRRLGRRPVAGVDEVRIPLKQNQIASAVGLTHVHVSRVLSQLRAQGLLDFHGEVLRILDTQRLEDLADVADDSIDAWVAEALGCRPEEVTLARGQG